MEISYIVIGFGILYIGSFIGQQIIDAITNRLEKNHDAKCPKTEHYYQYAGKCGEKVCRDKKPMQTYVIT